ncbi:MAG: hypothetical protein ACT4PM_11080 [Gemmatimonadales bacterium]
MQVRFAVGVLAILGVTAGHAQVVELRVREETQLTPIAGAIARLIGERGVVATGLTNELGRIVLRAPVAGIYRVRIDRIGWSGMLTTPFALADTVRLDIRMATSRIELPAVVVRGRNQCGLGVAEGGLVSQLWDEVRKILTVTVLSREAVPLHVRGFERELTLGGAVQREWVSSSRIVQGPPFQALPPSFLLARGFVRNDGDSLAFVAPDAETLLSEEFMVTHCFRPVAGRDQLVGLRFEPVRNRDVSDVAGTLWLDRASGELRGLDYSYTRLQDWMRRLKLGGTVEFRRLADGRWIVRYWHIRMPKVEIHARWEGGREVERGFVAGYVEKGGRAEPATDTLGRMDRAVLIGQVFDSTVGRGLGGAVVGVAGTPDSIVTGPDGQFELAIQLAGDQVVTAHHPKLGLLGEPLQLTALLSLGDTTPVHFVVPSVATFMRQLCRNQRGLAIVGMVFDAQGRPADARQVYAVRRTVRGDLPIGAVAVRSLGPMERRSPDDPGAGHTGVNVRGLTRGRPRAETNRRGLYAICNVPREDTLYVISAESGLVRGEAAVGLRAGSRWVDIKDWGSADTTVVRPRPVRPPSPH